VNWEDIDRHPSDRKVRQFAVICCCVFSSLAAFQFAAGHRTSAISWLVAAAIVGGLGAFAPKLGRPVFIAFTIATFPIGWVVSWIVLAVIFYLIVTPLAMIFRLRGRDPLYLRETPEGASLWRERQEPEDDRQYFRQF
jgi:hypothetical protein